MVWRAVAVVAATALWLVLLGLPGGASSPSVLLVGPAGTAGAQYQHIQDAVDAASPGDWILIAPGVYHEKGRDGDGVLVAKPDLHLLGLDRNRGILHGSNRAAGNTAETTLHDGRSS